MLSTGYCLAFTHAKHEVFTHAPHRCMGMRKFQIFALYFPHFAGGAEVRAGAGHHPGGQNAMSAACTWRSICERRVIFPSLTDGKMSSACLSISFLQNEMRVSDVARPKQIRALVHAREEVFCPKDMSRAGPPSARQLIFSTSYSHNIPYRNHASPRSPPVSRRRPRFRLRPRPQGPCR